MPLARQFGYLFSDGTDESKSSLAITAAHELGHGIFGLEHPFSRFSIPQGTTDWLMDYSQGIALPHVHWAQMYDPEFRLYLFQGEEEGESMLAFSDVSSNGITIYEDGLTYFSPSGALIKFNQNPDSVYLSTCRTKDFAQGTLCNFQYDGIDYTSVYRPGSDPPEFHGYYQLDYLEGIKKQGKISKAPEDEGMFSEDHFTIVSDGLVRVKKTVDCQIIEYDYLTSTEISELRGPLLQRIDIPVQLASTNNLGIDPDCEFCDETDDFAYKNNVINYETFRPYAFFELSKPLPDGSSQEVFQEIIERQATDLKSNLRAYINHPYDETSFYHFINTQKINIGIGGSRLIEIEHKLALLKEETGINIIVNIQEIEYNVPQSKWNELAREVAIQADLNTGPNILINIPYVDLIKYVNRDYEESYLMPGIWEAGGLLTSEFYQITFPKIDNLYQLILETYKDIDKPYVVYGGYLSADNETVNVYTLVNIARKRGEASIYQVQLYVDQSLPQIEGLKIQYETCIQSFSGGNCLEYYRQIQDIITQSLVNPTWEIKEYSNKVKEKYIRDYHNQIAVHYLKNGDGKYDQLLEQYQGSLLPEDAFYPFETIEFIYDINDGLGMAGSIFGVDAVFDISGVVITVFDDDPVRGSMNMAFNSAAVIVPNVTGGMVKGAAVGGVSLVILTGGKLLRRTEIKTAEELVLFYRIDRDLASRIIAKSDDLNHLWKNDAVYDAIRLRPRAETTKLLEDILDNPKLGEIFKHKPYLARSWLKVTNEP